MWLLLELEDGMRVYVNNENFEVSVAIWERTHAVYPQIRMS